MQAANSAVLNFLMKHLYFLLFCLLSATAFAQKADPAAFAQYINPDNLRKHEEVLTSDSLEGRETGTEGNRKAAQYISGQLAALQLPKSVGDSSYFQKVIYTNQGWTNLEMSVDSAVYHFITDFYAFTMDNASTSRVDAKEVVFLGYGVEDEKYNDYKNANVAGKVILIYNGEPRNRDSLSFLSGLATPSEWSANRRKKLEAARRHGVKAVLIVDDHFLQTTRRFNSLNPSNSIGETEDPNLGFPPNVYITPAVAQQIVGDRQASLEKARLKILTGKPASATFPCKLSFSLNKYFNQLVSANVLGFIEGTDPQLKKEIVVVSAHFDHLGKAGSEVYHGADDNASGTSGVLTIARALTEAKKQGLGPRRSVLCLFMTGEEKGLLGSNYYVNFPLYPLANTVADVNIDMIGRVDDEHLNDPNYIYVIGSNRLSTELHQIDSVANDTYTHLALDYRYNAPNDPNRYYYRSDHYNFAQRGIPAIFYFNGTHADYHRTTDTIDKINFEKMAKVAQLAYYTVFELANRNERIKVDGK